MFDSETFLKALYNLLAICEDYMFYPGKIENLIIIIQASDCNLIKFPFRYYKYIYKIYKYIFKVASNNDIINIIKFSLHTRTYVYIQSVTIINSNMGLYFKYKII
jgi:hypothetical protein